MNQEIQKILEKQHYGVVGEHSAVKLCHWLKQSLLHKRHCYKQEFYGIQSHRCLQITPAVNHCNQTCLYCWRSQQFTEKTMDSYDEPEFILKEAIIQQQRLITGFKGDPRCDQQKWQEANQPNMVACSLSGEPTLYPELDSFFELCHNNDMTTFLVSNGTTPHTLENMHTLPHQLYISLTASNPELYKKINVPLINDGWERLNQTLELLNSLNTRTVIRHTLVSGWNMDDTHIKEYSKLIEKANPDFIEPKAYVCVGHSRKRLTLANMPTHDAVLEFSKKLAAETGYHLIREKKDSRVALLAKRPDIKTTIK